MGSIYEQLIWSKIQNSLKNLSSAVKLTVQRCYANCYQAQDSFHDPSQILKSLSVDYLQSSLNELQIQIVEWNKH